MRIGLDESHFINKEAPLWLYNDAFFMLKN
jgi:hypothetical protein